MAPPVTLPHLARLIIHQHFRNMASDNNNTRYARFGLPNHTAPRELFDEQDTTVPDYVEKIVELRSGTFVDPHRMTTLDYHDQVEFVKKQRVPGTAWFTGPLDDDLETQVLRGFTHGFRFRYLIPHEWYRTRDGVRFRVDEASRFHNEDGPAVVFEAIDWRGVIELFYFHGLKNNDGYLMGVQHDGSSEYVWFVNGKRYAPKSQKYQMALNAFDEEVPVEKRIVDVWTAPEGSHFFANLRFDQLIANYYKTLRLCSGCGTRAQGYVDKEHDKLVDFVEKWPQFRSRVPACFNMKWSDDGHNGTLMGVKALSSYSPW